VLSGRERPRDRAGSRPPGAHRYLPSERLWIAGPCERRRWVRDHGNRQLDQVERARFDRRDAATMLVAVGRPRTGSRVDHMSAPQSPPPYRRRHRYGGAKCCPPISAGSCSWRMAAQSRMSGRSGRVVANRLGRKNDFVLPGPLCATPRIVRDRPRQRHVFICAAVLELVTSRRRSVLWTETTWLPDCSSVKSRGACAAIRLAKTPPRQRRPLRFATRSYEHRRPSGIMRESVFVSAG